MEKRYYGTLCFELNTKESMEKLFEAEKIIRGNLNIWFDSGAGYGQRDWELDWSLKGAVLTRVNPNRRSAILVIPAQTNKRLELIMKAEQLMHEAGIKFEAITDSASRKWYLVSNRRLKFYPTEIEDFEEEENEVTE